MFPCLSKSTICELLDSKTMHINNCIHLTQLNMQKGPKGSIDVNQSSSFKTALLENVSHQGNKQSGCLKRMLRADHNRNIQKEYDGIKKKKTHQKTSYQFGSMMGTNNL